MAKYVSFFSFTPETWSRLIDDPEDRPAAVGEFVEAMGGSLEAFYWMFGEHDGLVIIEAPDAVGAAGMAVAVAGSGAFEQVETHRLLDRGESAQVLANAARARSHYAPPGAPEG